MKNIFRLFIIMIFGSCYPSPKIAGQFTNAEFDSMADQMAKGDTPYIEISDITNHEQPILLLDAREKKEYDISHIKGAIWIGYDDFDIRRVPAQTSKGQKYVVYCSVGYRSERIGEKLIKNGFQNVYNLKGSIFQWVNEGNEIVDEKGKPTENIHGFNSKWSKWLKTESIVF